MEITLKNELATFDLKDVHAALRAALQHEVALARARRDSYKHQCQEFESHYRLTSDEFMKQFENGTLGDDPEYFDWYAAKRGLDIWARRSQILAGISL